MIVRVFVWTACFSLLSQAIQAQNVAPSWLDRPLATWNTPAAPLPQPPREGETVEQLAARCRAQVRLTTPAERVLADAGWLPYPHVDRQIVERDVEIIGGMMHADAMCRPMTFNVFVFVGGRFAGTLSPVTMNSRSDGDLGAVRLAPDDTIAAEFSRYTNADALCCPSDRFAVRYRIDRTGSHPVVIPISAQSRRR